MTSKIDNSNVLCRSDANFNQDESNMAGVPEDLPSPKVTGGLKAAV